MDLDYGGNFFFLFFIAFREQNVFKETDELAPDQPARSDVVIGELRVQLERSKTELEETKEQLLLLRQSKNQLSLEACWLGVRSVTKINVERRSWN